MRLLPVSTVSAPQPSSRLVPPSSVQPPVTLEPAASSTTSREAVIASLRERLARRDAESTKLDEPFFAHKEYALELESSSAKATSSERNLRSQV